MDGKMLRSKPKRVPKKESIRNYRDFYCPDPNLMILDWEYEEEWK